MSLLCGRPKYWPLMLLVNGLNLKYRQGKKGKNGSRPLDSHTRFSQASKGHNCFFDGSRIPIFGIDR